LNEYLNCNYCIYKIHSKKTNGFYIGSTCNFDKRMKEHLKDAKTKDLLLYKCMREYKIENFEFTILEQFYAETTDEALQVEQNYINYLNPNLNMKSSYRIKL